MRIVGIVAGAVATIAGLVVVLVGPDWGWVIIVVGVVAVVVQAIVAARKRPQAPPAPRPPTSTFKVGNRVRISGDKFSSNADTAFEAGDDFESTVKDVDHKPFREEGKENS